jgi:hypothetical protein
MFSACLTCKSARKPKECGAGYAYCITTRVYVEVMALCPQFEHMASYTSALVESAPLVGGSVNPVAEVPNPLLNGRLTLGFPSCSASTTATNSGRPEYSDEKSAFAPKQCRAF